MAIVKEALTRDVPVTLLSDVPKNTSFSGYPEGGYRSEYKEIQADFNLDEVLGPFSSEFYPD